MDETGFVELCQKWKRGHLKDKRSENVQREKVPRKLTGLKARDVPVPPCYLT